MQTHLINGIEFIIEQDTDGWFWLCDDTDVSRFFPVRSEALADAMAWVSKQASEEAERREQEEQETIYGTYEQQVASYYKSTRI